MELLCKDDGEDHFNKLLLQLIEKQNNAEVLAILKNADLCQITNKCGDTLLHVAAGYGNVSLARYLTDLGANVDAQNHLKETPLMFAVQSQETETTKLLLEANAEIFIRNMDGKCALRKAFYISKLISNIICKTAKDFHELQISKNIINILEERVTIASLNDGNRVDNKLFHIDYPLYTFILMKDAEITRVLLEKGSPVDAKDPDTGNTSLHIAVRAMDLQKIELLLKHNADVNMKNHEGKTPLAGLSFLRDRAKAPAIANMLMAAGADLIDRDRGAILVPRLLSYGNNETIRDVLKYRIDLHFIDEFNMSALHYLAHNKNPDVLAELRDFDFRVNIETRNCKMTMLHFAANRGNASSVKFLLDRGADVNATCTEGDTPLGCIFIRSYCFRNGNDVYDECVEVLLARGADPRIVTEKHYHRHMSWLNQRISNAFIKFMNLLIIHLSALEASGQYIGYIMRKKIQTNPQFKKVFDSKKVELEEMKLIKLGRSVTLLDFLVASKEDVSLYARNRRIMLVSLNAIKKDSLDPCYQRKLHESSLKFNKLIELRKKSAVVLDKIFGELYGIPVYDIAEKIVDYLDDHELCKLLGTIS